MTQFFNLKRVPVSVRRLGVKGQREAIATLREFAKRQRDCRISMSEMVTAASLDQIEKNGEVFDLAADLLQVVMGEVPEDRLPERVNLMEAELAILRDKKYDALKERARADMAENQLRGASDEIEQLQILINKIDVPDTAPVAKLAKLVTNRPG